MAPEVFQNKVHSFPVDFYSLGVIAFELLTGRTPFAGERGNLTEIKIFKNALKNQISFPEGIDDVTRDFIKSLCEKDPSKRLGS